MSRLIQMVKLYTLIAFVLPFPVAYWTGRIWIDVFALFFFPLWAEKLEQTRSGNVAAWLMGVSAVYFLFTIWTVITLISHLFGNPESVYGEMPAGWAGALCILYAFFALYGFVVVKELNRLLRLTQIQDDDRG